MSNKEIEKKESFSPHIRMTDVMIFGIIKRVNGYPAET